jgi:hypothetical protein
MRYTKHCIFLVLANKASVKSDRTSLKCIGTLKIYAEPPVAITKRALE